MTAAAVSQLVEGAARSRPRDRSGRSVFQSAFAFAGAAFLWMQLSLVGIAAICSVVAGHRPVMITGGSMRPSVSRGDVVIINKVDPATLEAGHLVMFDIGEGRVTHRIVGFTDDGEVLTKGDANAIADTTPVPASSIIGRVRVIVPSVGLPLIWWQDQNWTPLLLWIGLTTLAIFAVISKPKPSERLVEHVELPVEPVSIEAAPAIVAGPMVAPILVRLYTTTPPPASTPVPAPEPTTAPSRTSTPVRSRRTRMGDASKRTSPKLSSIRAVKRAGVSNRRTSSTPHSTTKTGRVRSGPSPVSSRNDPSTLGTASRGPRIATPTPRIGRAVACSAGATAPVAKPIPRVGRRATPASRLSPTPVSAFIPPTTGARSASHPLLQPPIRGRKE